MTETIVEAGATAPAPRGTDPGPAPDYMSYSRMNSITTCGEQFRLERIIKVPVVEHWASIGGNAFHSSVEAIMRAELSGKDAI